MALEKAKIKNLATEKEIECRFNPTEYTLSKSNKWEPVKVIGQDVPLPKFIGGDPITLSMTLFFDTFAEKIDVRKEYTDELLRLLYVDPDRKDDNRKGRPPCCSFKWGTQFYFEAILTTMTQNFTLFLEDGTPVRATVGVTFQQVKQQGKYKEPQNPTSQGTYGYRSRVVIIGDRLDLIAYDEYGDPSLWHIIAEASNLEDPLRLVPGQRLVIVPRKDIRE